MNYALLKFLDVNRVNVFACCIVLFQALFNGPFTSCPQPLFQSEAKCKAIDMKMIFHSHANKTHFRSESKNKIQLVVYYQCCVLIG